MNPFRISPIHVPARHRPFNPDPARERFRQPSTTDYSLGGKNNPDCPMERATDRPPRPAGFTFGSLHHARSTDHIWPADSPPIIRGLHSTPTLAEVADRFPIVPPVRSVEVVGGSLLIRTNLKDANRRPIVLYCYLKYWGGRAVAVLHDGGAIVQSTGWPANQSHLIARNAPERRTTWTVEPTGRLVLPEVPMARLAELSGGFAMDCQGLSSRLDGLMRAGQRAKGEPTDRLIGREGTVHAV